MRCALVFCHGIANGPEDRAKKLPLLLDYFARHSGIKELFSIIGFAEWRSLGDFAGDLFDLTIHKVRREEAVEDVRAAILQIQNQLIGQADKAGDNKPPRLILIGHSMGQVMMAVALKRLATAGMVGVIPTDFISIGGPLGNTSPLVTRPDWVNALTHNLGGLLGAKVDDAMRGGIQWAIDELETTKTLGVNRWVDIWNPDDVICSHPFSGYARHPLVTKSVMVQVPNTDGSESKFIREHTGYWRCSELYDEIRTSAGVAT